jgi:hypothetical protein
MYQLGYYIIIFHVGCSIVGLTSIILGFLRNIDVITIDKSTYNSSFKYYYLIFVYYPAQIGYKLNKKICK